MSKQTDIGTDTDTDTDTDDVALVLVRAASRFLPNAVLDQREAACVATAAADAAWSSYWP